MMKIKTTKKAIREGNYYIISIGYCNAQNLLHYKEAFAYNAGNNGWNCDFYQIDSSTIISTGYSTIKNKNTKTNYDLIKKYDNMAEKIIYNYDDGLTWDQKKEKVNELLEQFVKECKED